MTDNDTHDWATDVDTVIDMQTGQRHTGAEMTEVVRERLPREAVERVRVQQHPQTDDDVVVVDMAREEEVTWAEARRRAAARFVERDYKFILTPPFNNHMMRTVSEIERYRLKRASELPDTHDQIRELAWLAKNSDHRILANSIIDELGRLDAKAGWDAIEWIATHRADPVVVRMAIETLAREEQTERLRRIADEDSLGSAHAQEQLKALS